MNKPLPNSGSERPGIFFEKGTALFGEFEITSEGPVAHDFDRYIYSAKGVLEKDKKEYTILQVISSFVYNLERLEQWEQLEHPNIRRMCRLYSDGGNELVMVFEGPYDGGHSISSLKGMQENDWDKFFLAFLDIALGCARGLAYLHDRSFAHCDIKPDNLYGTGEGVQLDGILGSTEVYTPAYASPEQIHGRPVTVSTDIWSLGVTLMEMLLGERLWLSGVECGLKYEEYLKDLPHALPVNMLEMLRSCFKEDPEDRINARELIMMLELLRLAAAPERPAFRGYTRLRRISRGGEYDVWLAEDLSKRRLVLKQLLPRHCLSVSCQAQMRNEAEFLYRYGSGRIEGHQNILCCVDKSGEHDFLYYYATEYCGGGDLESLVERKGRLPLKTAVHIASQLLSALEFLHGEQFPVHGKACRKNPIYHKNICPRSILLMDESDMQEIRLKGFEASVYKGDESNLHGIGWIYSIITPGFSCKDAITNSMEFEPARDVWAAAAVLYYMITGSTPKKFEAGRDLWLQAAEKEAVPIRECGIGVPGPLAEIIDDALRERPLNRQSSGEFREKLLRAYEKTMNSL